MLVSAHSSPACAVETVFAIPELFHHIQSFLNKVDNVSLMSLSRWSFMYAARVVWESVELKQLLQLVKGVQMTPPERAPSLIQSVAQKHCVVTFPNSIELTRFRLYSPFVKVLRADGPYSIDFSSQLPTPLLPNIQRLMIYAHGSMETKYVNWISRLLTPSLRELKLLSIDQQETLTEPDCRLDLTWLDLDTYLNLIDKISATCPQIETLRLFGAGQGCRGRGWADSWRSWILRKHSQLDPIDSMSVHFHTFYPNYVSFDKIASLHHLHSLTITIPYIGQALLLTLGQLLRLENLSLHINVPMLQPLDDSTITLPANSFTSLRHLTLYRPHPFIFERFSQPSPLFRNLTTARIYIESSQGDDRVTLRRLPSDAVFQCLTQSSLTLSSLTISSYVERNCFTLFWSTVNIFSQMPLKRLDLGSIQFDPRPIAFAVEASGMRTNVTQIKWNDFLAAVPLLEELDLSRQEITIQELRMICTMLPDLRSLVLCSIQLEEALETLRLPAILTVNDEPITIRAGFRGQFAIDDAYIVRLVE
ncbi:hypothetical protein FRC12_005793 [Ceratobasidium sp. 428]|nr:hypothetical protein FRC12_005793 [Ceratobasidium sp. 428]